MEIGASSFKPVDFWLCDSVCLWFKSFNIDNLFCLNHKILETYLAYVLN